LRALVKRHAHHARPHHSHHAGAHAVHGEGAEARPVLSVCLDGIDADAERQNERCNTDQFGSDFH
jgi:hypothetical protein